MPRCKTLRIVRIFLIYVKKMQLRKQLFQTLFILCAGVTFYSCSSDQEGPLDNISIAKDGIANSEITGMVTQLAGGAASAPATRVLKSADAQPKVSADTSISEILESTNFTAHCLIKVSNSSTVKHTEVSMTAETNADGKEVISVKDANKVFYKAVGREPQSGEVWKMAIVAGGGKWDEASKRVVFSIDGNDGVSSYGDNHLTAPLATNWTTIVSNSDGSYKANLSFSIRGTLVRLNVNNELADPFVRAIRLNSKALCRKIYFDMNTPTPDGNLIWKPLANGTQPTIVTNSSVPARNIKQFVFWGMPTAEQNPTEYELNADQYGYTLLNQTNDKLYNRKGDFVAGKVSELDVRIANIKMPIAYFAKTNYTGHPEWAFTNSSYNDQSYYVYNRALDILSDLDTQRKGWHVPSVFEWAAVIPRSHAYTEEAASKPLIYLDGKSNHINIMAQNEEVECPRNNFITYRSQYVNVRKGVNYAIRFAPPTAKVRWRSAAGYVASFHTRPVPFAQDHRYYAAYKYEVVDNAGNGHPGILVTVRYLGESGKDMTLCDINDEFWSHPAPSGISDVQVAFPFYGYMNQGNINRKVNQQDEACYYWTVTPGGSLVPLAGWMTYITNARSISLRNYQLNESHDGRQYRYLLRLVSSK